MTSVLILLSGFDPGTYFIEDDDDPFNGIAQLRLPDGDIIFFNIPTEFLTVTASAGRSIVFNLTEWLGTADINVGNLTNPAENPDFIQVREIAAAGDVLLVSNGAITELGADAPADITASTLILSAASGVGTSGNALETQVATIEAETTTGGINLLNFGNLIVGGLSGEVNGLDVATSGNLKLINFGGIDVNDATGLQSIHGGNTSGNVTLIADGFDSDIRSLVDLDFIAAPGGNIVLQAGRDVSLGTQGANFDNDVRARGSLTITTGRDLNVDGFADLASDGFGAATGGNVLVNAGRDINILNSTGTDASLGAEGSGGGDTILNTGPGGFVRLLAGSTATLFSSTGDVSVNADRLIIGGASGITAGSGNVTIAPRTAGWNVDLGSVTDGAFALEISDAELDRIFTPNLIVGSNNAGRVTVSSGISPAGVSNMIIRSGTDVDLAASLTLSGDLTIRALDNINQLAASTITVDDLRLFVDSVDDDPGVGGNAFLNGTVAVASNIVTGNLDADTLSGSAQADTLIGLAGNDRLDGNSGDDFLIGGLGADKLIGDGGIDTVDYTGNFGAISVNLTTNLGQFNFAQGDVYSEIENANGTEFNDILTGSAVVNVLNGNGGDDIIKGNAGADIMNGGAGIDTADYSGNFGAVSIDLAAGTGQFNFAQGDVLTGFENAIGTEFGDTLTGTTGINRLEGRGGNDKLVGGNGDDELIGGADNDNLIGGLGADVHDGGAGVDTANYSGNFGAVSVNLFTGVGASNFAQGDTYISIEKVIGTDFNDIMESNGVTNVFTGGLGNDTFIFRPGFSEDIITDFDGNGAAAGDTIRFRTGVFTDFADMLASASQQGSDVVIEADPSNILILKNVLLGDLHSSDFIFG